MVNEIFRPRWAHLYPEIAKVEREINEIAERLRLPKFKVIKVSDEGRSVMVVILAYKPFWGFRRALSLPSTLLNQLMSLRCFLWNNYIDLAFRFVLTPKVYWVAAPQSSTSVVTEIYPKDYLNYIYLTLERFGKNWQVEVRSGSDESLTPLPEPVRITYSNWNLAIEGYLQLLQSLSMSEPDEIWEIVKHLSGLSIL
jgi:hypothetical protein